MKKAAVISSLCFLLLTCNLPACLANNITVSAISLTNRNTTTKTVRVNFNLTWDNSWRTTSAPFNWDAAWVFVKYRVGTTGEWKHATLATSGHILPGIAASTQTDATGIFIYRSAAGTGTFNPTGIQLQWNYGSDGVANEARIFVRVFAIEMVYNQVGGFQAGSGAISNGEFRRANDVTASAPASTFTITGSLPTFQSNNSSSSANNIAAYNNTASDLTGTTTASLNAGYPTGFDAFYSMKYEISQQQYVDFLNTLTYTQQALRTATAPNSAAGTGALINPNDYRNGIDIQTSGTNSTVPAVYACNLDNDGIYNEADDGQHIACNYLSWDDLTAYLDWAGLRPMTELEYEKSCRGNQLPVSGEYPWGTTSRTELSGISNPGSLNEIATNSSSNIATGNTYGSGPVRTGIFANSSTTRATSGAGYYGNIDLGGNVVERLVSIGNSDGRAFSGNHGNGSLASSGDADVAGWPAVAGTGWKGGSFYSPSFLSATSNRTLAANGNNLREQETGGRGVRTISPGIVTDGLVLWLDAGITPSYPGTGTIWTDLSGNRNDGTLTNGPTFNSGNQGSIVFDGVDDYISIGSQSIVGSGSAPMTVNLWLYNTKTLSNNQYSMLFRVKQTTEFFSVFYFTGGIHYIYSSFRNENQWATPITYSDYQNQWICLTYVYTGGGKSTASSFEIYRNGIKIPTGTTNLGTAGGGGSNCNIIGVDGNVGCNTTVGYMNGNLGIYQLYSRALNASEVLQNFNAQKARFGL